MLIVQHRYQAVATRAEDLEESVLATLGNLPRLCLLPLWSALPSESTMPTTTYSLPSLQFYMLEFCSYHPTEPEFPAIQFKNSTLPLGEFPCCGETAVRFQPIAQVSNTLFLKTQSNLDEITLFCAGWGGLQVPGSQSEGAQPKGLRDVPHPDDSQVTPQPHNELLLDRDVHRDLICVTPKRKSGLLRLPGEVASVSLPSPRAESVRATKQQSSKTQNPKKATSKA